MNTRTCTIVHIISKKRLLSFHLGFMKPEN